MGSQHSLIESAGSQTKVFVICIKLCYERVHLTRERTMARTSPLEFMRQVRQEVSKVTWPSRKETIITTILVFLMVFICAVFFLVVDRILSWSVHWILGMGA